MSGLSGVSRSGRAIVPAATLDDRRTDELRRQVTVSSERRESRRRRVLAAADALGLAVSLAAATLFAGRHALGANMAWAALTLPVWTALFKVYGLYDLDAKRISHSTVDDIPRLFHAVVIGDLLLWFFFKLLAPGDIVLPEAVIFGTAALVALVCLRWAARRAIASALGAERVLFVGEDPTAAVLVRKMQAHPEYELQAVGVLAPEFSPDLGDDLPILGAMEDLHSVVLAHQIDRIVVTPAGLDLNDQLHVLRTCRELSLKVSLLPLPFDAMGPAVEVDDIEGITLLGMNPPQLTRSSRFMKRTLDLIGATFGLLLFAGPMLVTAIAIKIDSRGPVLFKQHRIGRGGRRFTVWKFRTMVVDAEDQVEELRALSMDPQWLHLEHDPRITRVGRFLRLASLDELPQLVNVLQGYMSLVGPRPLIESEDRRVDGWARSRLHLTPGITGSWQVLGRTSIPFDEMVKLDYLYVMNWSLWTDVRLILRTLPVVFTRRGAN
jgi:exopolysaccharide biosynthesis polyprenyl glycosylphosphotransferase